MNRRSWLQTIWGGDGDDLYFFGLQLLVHAFGEDTLRARLAEVISDPEGALEDTGAKRRYIKRVVSLLLEHEAFWSQACWDYKEGRAEAEAEFESWLAEISAGTATESEEMGGELDGALRSSNEKDYVAVTIILKLTAPFPPAQIDDEKLYWQSTTVGKLVRGLLLVNPESIAADGIFIIPGNAEDGLSERDLLTGGWSHLRVLN